MKAYWMFWWGRTANPLRQLSVIHWLGIILAVLFFALACFVSSLADRVLICSVVIAPIWGYWVLQVKKIAGPVNLLVPQLRRRLLKTSIAHWLIVTLLFAFASTIRERLDHFFAVGLLIGCGLLAFAWLASLRNVWMAAAGGIGLVCGVWLIAAFLRWNDHGSIAMVMLLLGWLVMPFLAWFTLNTFLGDGALRHAKVDQARRKVPLRNAIHHWFLRRMGHSCANTSLRPAVLERVRLEARLNFSFGPAFHWSAFFVSWAFGLFVFWSLLAGHGHNGVGSFDWFGFVRSDFYVMFLIGNIYRFWLMQHVPTLFQQMSIISLWNNSATTIANRNAISMKGLMFLAPGLPQGLALHQARARISLRYFLIVWAGSVALYALVFSGLSAGMRDHALVMIATAELAMMGSWVGSSRYNWWSHSLQMTDRMPRFIGGVMWMFLVIVWPTVSTKYVWFLFMLAPSWYLETISLPLWTASCLLGGGAFLWLRWQKLAMEPDGLPAEWR